MPFGEYDIYNEQHLLEALAQLIIEHLDIQRWLFKIDDDFDGLGIAYCDVVTHLPCYKNVLKEAARFGDKWSNKWAQVKQKTYRNVLFQCLYLNFRNNHVQKFFRNYPMFLKNILFV